ncbi:MAG: hypothetical protein JW958_05155 [Candidatus Eisenbacteria bacterium]|nr:hypothetical protein [Candidatus Eisenbacteria bacterium]
MIGKDRGLWVGLLAFLLLSTLSGCFETGEKSWRKIRIFYSSDMIGGIEPVG